MFAGKFLAPLLVVAALGSALFAITQKVESVVPPQQPVAAASDLRISYPKGNLPRLDLPDGRTLVVRSVLNINRPMKFGDYVWNDENVPQGPVWVRVDVAKQLISAFREGHEIGTSVILYGADSHPSPIGIFTILEKNEDYHSRTYDAPMPFMLRLTDDGVAIHGSNVRSGWATHGCIGVPLDFARRLYGEMKLGDQVIIVNSKV